MKYCISDIHGHFDEFMEILKLINFTDEDELYVLGDCIDKGLKSIETFLYCLEHENIHTCLGNHEFMMYQYLRAIKREDQLEKKYFQTQWFTYNHGRKTYDQYMKLPRYKRDKVYNKLGSMKLCFSEVCANDKAYYLVHSCPFKTEQETIPCVNNYTDDEIESSVWARDVDLISDRIVVHGHTICQDEKIHVNESEINIDCGAAADWSLGCLCLDNMKEYYIKLPHSKFI